MTLLHTKITIKNARYKLYISFKIKIWAFLLPKCKKWNMNYRLKYVFYIGYQTLRKDSRRRVSISNNWRCGEDLGHPVWHVGPTREEQGRNPFDLPSCFCDRPKQAVTSVYPVPSNHRQKLQVSNVVSLLTYWYHLTRLAYQSGSYTHQLTVLRKRLQWE